MFGQTVAIRLGLSESDIRALELLVDADPVTAGRLAELLNLSTGAVTRDPRPPGAGRLRPAHARTPPTDGAWSWRSCRSGCPPIREALEPLGDADAIVVAAYSDKELEVINDFLTRMADAQRARADALREDPGTFAGTGEHSAPLGALREARLLFRPGVTDVTITGGLATTELFRARFDGTQPSVRVRDGTVVIAYRGGCARSSTGGSAALRWT